MASVQLPALSDALKSGLKRKDGFQSFKLPPAKIRKVWSSAHAASKLAPSSPALARSALLSAQDDHVQRVGENEATVPESGKQKPEVRASAIEGLAVPVSAVQDLPVQKPVSPDSALNLNGVAAGQHVTEPSQQTSTATSSSQTQPSSTHATALAKLLAEPIRFVPATKLTLDDESRVLRKRFLVRYQPPVERERRAFTTAISKTWPNPAPSRPQGLRNPGAFCYRLGVLQALFHLPVFFNWLHMHNCTAPEHCLACALKHLAKAYWQQPGRVNQCLNRLNEVVRTTGRRCNPRWSSHSVHEQADAHEFMGWILEFLQHRLNSPDALDGMFKIQHRASWECQDCHHVHDGPAIDDLGLQLQIVSPKPNLHLSKYVNQYYNEVVEDARCEKCSSKKDRNRVISITAAPDVLIIQLRRFETTRTGGRRKLISKVIFDEWLDLSRHSADPVLRKSRSIQYKLSSVVHHAGRLGSGHYIAVAQSPAGLFKLNDDYVCKATKGDFFDPGSDFTPYILTYISCDQARAGTSD